jgi:predicted dithiol-disulfide oxidoreductase (DUF899 family)
MNYLDSRAAITAKREEIMALQAELRAMQTEAAPEPVEDHVLTGWDGPVRLSELFAGKRDLIVIHNMGIGCTSCTMWADGFNGVYEHLAARAAFVVASPNPVEVQKRVAASRGWRFPMVSYDGNQFAEAMGFRHRGDDECYGLDEKLGGWNPGVSVFRRDTLRIVRVSDAEFGPGDGFCVVYALLDMIPGTDHTWQPKLSYA